MGTWRDQASMKCMDWRIVFSRALCRTIWFPSRRLSAQSQRRLIRHPNLGQEAAYVEAGEHCGVDDIGLDPDFGNQANLTGFAITIRPT
jgi:hypothetical protein